MLSAVPSMSCATRAGLSEPCPPAAEISSAAAAATCGVACDVPAKNAVHDVAGLGVRHLSPLPGPVPNAAVEVE